MTEYAFELIFTTIDGHTRETVRIKAESAKAAFLQVIEQEANGDLRRVELVDIS